ncbi:MAG: rod shape-determining protein MreC [Chloroflexi bacterium]|nr:MAG: rod shape-determining protein MreC [Chloroflexota bacterium]
MRRFSFLGRFSLGLLLLAAAVLLLALGQRAGGLRAALTRVLTPLQQFVAQQTLPLRQPGSSGAPAPVLTQVAELQERVSSLQGEVTRLRESESQRLLLAQLLKLARSNPEYSYLAAQVIGRDVSPYLQYVLVDRGRADGLLPDMPVLAADGLVGIVTEATASAAKVLLITDPTLVVNVRVQRSRVEGQLRGSGPGLLRLDFLPMEAQLEAGDQLVTSGIGGKFPPNLQAGTITSVRRRDYDVFQEADVQSAINFSNLELVLIITNFTPLDLAPLLATPAPATP